MQQATRKIKTGVHFRALEIVKRADGSPAIDEERRTVECTFSSEYPVKRYWGTEILSHEPGACDLSRLADGRAPVLVDYHYGDQVGVVDTARIGDDKRGYATLRFSRSTRGQETFQDVADGIRSQISVGYRIVRAVLEETSEDDGEIYRVVEWQPLEVTLVQIAADPTVGVGRSGKDAHGECAFETILEVRGAVPAPDTKGERSMTTGNGQQTQPAGGTPAAPAAITDAQRTAIVEDLTKREDERIRDILAVATTWQCREDGLKAIADGRTAAEFKGWVLETKVPRGEPLSTPTTAIGVSGKDLDQYSIVRAAKALASRDWKGAELELEASRACEKALGREARGFLVPWEVLAHRAPQVPGMESRAPVAKSGSGGNLVDTVLLAESFIDLLRNKMVLRNAGMTILPGLVGDVAIPRQSGAATAAWVTEGAGAGDTPQTFDQVTLSPKTVRARSDMTRRMLLQSTPAIEQLVRRDLALQLALAADLAGLHGTGAGGQPTGVALVSGIGSVVVGTNGGPPTWDHVVAFETEVAVDNADIGALAYITNARMRGKMKRTEKAATTAQYLWEMLGGEYPVNGYRAFVTNQVRSDFAKGSGTNLSAAFFGNWADLLFGEWGTLDITAEAVTLGDSGGLTVRGFMDVDYALRHPESISYGNDFVTT